MFIGQYYYTVRWFGLFHTRWGSTHDLLKKAIPFRPVITQLYIEYTDSRISDETST